MTCGGGIAAAPLLTPHPPVPQNGSVVFANDATFTATGHTTFLLNQDPACVATDGGVIDAPGCNPTQVGR